MKHRILVVEDEPHLAFSLRLNLEAENYDVVIAKDGKEALQIFANSSPFDLFIVDVMLPELDGFYVVNEIRKINAKSGIIMLTARASDEDRIQGFKTGVDDYITKPFHLEELLLRIKRMITRADVLSEQEHNQAGSVQKNSLSVGEFSLDIESLEFKSPKGNFNLTPLEAEILKEFLTNPKRILSREYLLEKVWGMRNSIETRTVDNFIVRLRRYIEQDPANPEFLISIRGRGYRFILNQSQ